MGSVYACALVSRRWHIIASKVLWRCPMLFGASGVGIEPLNHSKLHSHTPNTFSATFFDSQHNRRNSQPAAYSKYDENNMPRSRSLINAFLDAFRSRRTMRLTRVEKEQRRWRHFLRTLEFSPCHPHSFVQHKVENRQLHSFWSYHHASAEINAASPHQSTKNLVGSCGSQFIQHLDLSLSHVWDVEVTDDHLLTLSKHSTNLQRLNLTSCAALTHKALIHVAVGAFSNSLQSLNLSGCVQVVDEGVFAIAAHCHRLRSINLKKCVRVTSAAIQAIATQCHEIERIRISHCVQVNDDALFTMGSSCGKLKWLDLGACPQVTDLGLLAMSRGCLRLQWLDVSRSASTTPSLTIPIPATPILTSLISSTRDHNHPPPSPTQLQDSDKPPSTCSITDVSLIAVVQACRELELLDLSYCRELSDATLCAVAEFGENLKSLSLKGLPHITATGIMALGELRQRKRQLIWLQIYNCERIGTQVIDSMIQKLNDGWRKGPFDTTVHREVMNGKCWDDVGW